MLETVRQWWEYVVLRENEIHRQIREGKTVRPKRTQKVTKGRWKMVLRNVHWKVSGGVSLHG